MAMLYPSRARRNAIDFPMPRLPPVIRTVLWRGELRSMFSLFLSVISFLQFLFQSFLLSSLTERTRVRRNQSFIDVLQPVTKKISTDKRTGCLTKRFSQLSASIGIKAGPLMLR